MSSFSFIFPGQGSQSIGMGQFLYNEFSVAKDIFNEANEALQFDLKKLCFEGDEKELSLTENTQPALLTTSYATAAVLKKHFNIHPQSVAGHSIGEYAALVTANVLSFSDAVKSVRARGKAMQSAVPAGEGGMTAAIGLSEEQVVFLCHWVEKTSGFKPLNPANFNCDGQIVLSGSLKVLNWWKKNFKLKIFLENNLPEAKRAKLIPLQVSAPFHCDLMKPAEDTMREYLMQIHFNSASVPIYQNFIASSELKSESLRENLIRQISAPVKWTQSVQKMKMDGFSRFIECGHGQVLKGLLKKIDPSFEVFSTQSIDDLKILEAAQK